MHQDYDYLFKIVIVGNSSVGKSSLLLRFAENSFSQSFLPTIGVDFKIKTIQSDKDLIKLQIWDTAGQQRFKTITGAYYKGSHGIIIAYDITDRQSFKDIQSWLNEIIKYGNRNGVQMLVGTKSDLQPSRQVKFQEGENFAKSHGMKFLEVSSKEGFNVNETFFTLANEIKSTVNSAKDLKAKEQVKKKNENEKPSFFQSFFSSKKDDKSNEQQRNQEKMSQEMNQMRLENEKNKQIANQYQNRIKQLEQENMKGEKKMQVPVKKIMKEENLYEILTSNGISDISIEILKSQDIKSLQDLKYLKDQELKQLNIKLGDIARIRKLLSSNDELE